MSMKTLRGLQFFFHSSFQTKLQIYNKLTQKGPLKFKCKNDNTIQQLLNINFKNIKSLEVNSLESI